MKMSFEDIQSHTKTQFNRKLEESIQVKALEYLLKKQRSKGQEIRYLELKMAEYLMPNFENISITDRRKIFELRNRMLPIPANFPLGKEEEICCGEIENTKHIYICQKWSDDNEKPSYEMIFSDNMPALTIVYKQYIVNLKNRESFKNEEMKNEVKIPHVIFQRDPLFSNVEFSNGNKH